MRRAPLIPVLLVLAAGCQAQAPARRVPPAAAEAVNFVALVEKANGTRVDGRPLSFVPGSGDGG